jgi:hypothetical protein
MKVLTANGAHDVEAVHHRSFEGKVELLFVLRWR